MQIPSVRVRHFAAILVVFVLLGASIPQTSAQSDEVSGLNGNSWTSPTFGYSASWDDQIWEVSLEYSSLTLDYLVLQSPRASVSIEFLYSYDGEPNRCMTTETHRIATDQGLTELVPVSTPAGEPIETIGDDVGQGFYELPTSAQDATLANVIYLECRSIVPGSVIMILTGFLDPAMDQDLFDAMLGLSAAVLPGPDGVPPLDLIALENEMWGMADNVDAFWADIFALQGLEYVAPNYQLVSFPIVIDCGAGPQEMGGAFYCPVDDTIYLDMEVNKQEVYLLGHAEIYYTIGHEVAHHVQSLLGLSGCNADGCPNTRDVFEVELQADCLSGAWIQHAFATGFLDGRAEYRILAGIKSAAERLGEAQGNYASGEEQKASRMAGYEGGIAACGIE